MRKVLVSWIGQTDLNAAAGTSEAGIGPLGQALLSPDFDEAHLLCDYPSCEKDNYFAWVKQKTKVKLVPHVIKLSSPTDFGEIYQAAVHVITKVLQKFGPDQTNLTFHLSPGTPAMAAVFVLLSKTRFPAELIQTSKQKGLERASVPFEIGREYIPDLLRRPDEEIERLSAGLSPEAPEFERIIRSKNSSLNRVIALARRAAPHRVPVLIEGETGTGKELMAKAIHNASPLRDKGFLTVNCGAIPKNSIESELFGHVKGAFTDAREPRKGHFIEANGGTIFLDEVGELPLEAQTKLLRVVEYGEVMPMGSSKTTKVNVRIVAATNRQLVNEVAAGRFRDDLYYRLAILVLTIPPLRERNEDLDLLTDGLIEQLYEDSSIQLGLERKTLSPEGKSILLSQTWPGNVRELRNTLLRAIIWSPTKTITAEDVRSALAQKSVQKETEVLNRSLGNGFNLQAVIKHVATHYIERALEQAHGNRTKAAKLVGAPSYQTLDSWRTRYGLSKKSGRT